MEQHEARTRRTVVTSLSTAFHVLGLLLTFLVGIAAYLTGIFYTFALWLILASVPILVMVRLWGLFRKQLAWHFIRRPLQRESRRYLLQGLNHWTFWLLMVFAFHLAIPRVLFSATELLQLLTILWGCVGVLMILALVPNKKIRLSTNISLAVASLFLVVEFVRILSPAPATDAVVLAPPFRGEWYVSAGGQSALINHHFPVASERYALDILNS